jgi:hypothetical protein
LTVQVGLLAACLKLSLRESGGTSIHKAGHGRGPSHDQPELPKPRRSLVPECPLKPHGIVLEEARIVADELGLPDWWLNEQASTYVAPDGDPSAPREFDHPGLRVAAASPEHLLAMKTLAARRRDSDDIRFLVRRLGLASVDEVLAVCAEVFPEEPIPERARLILEDALEAQAPDQGTQQ